MARSELNDRRLTLLGVLRTDLPTKLQQYYQAHWWNGNEAIGGRRTWVKTFAIFIVLVWLTLLPLPAIAQETVTPSNTVKTEHISTSSHPLLQPGADLFAAGRFADAAIAWENALDRLQTSTDADRAEAEAVGYYSLAQAYFSLGQWNAASLANTNSQKSLSGTHLERSPLFAASLNLEGQLQFAAGHPEQSLETWYRAEALYAANEDITGKLGSQLNLARAMQNLGYYQRSHQLLTQIANDIDRLPDRPTQAISLQLLGLAVQSFGNLERAQQLLAQSLELTQELARAEPVYTDQLAAVHTNLATILVKRDDTATALRHYRQAATIATSPLTRVEALIDELNLLARSAQWSSVHQSVPAILTELDALQPSRASIYARVNLASGLLRIQAPNSPLPNSDIAALLAQAITEARVLSDSRAESYSLGQLGRLYETNRQWDEARQVTSQAAITSESINAPDLAATWQWQLGRIFRQQGQNTMAIAAYSEAVDALQALRQDLVALTSDVQFSFIETVEPVYRELVSLLLDSSPSQRQLEQARYLIEALQVAELDNFFQQACLEAQTQPIDTVDASAAVLYPIILPDRLAVIVSRPGQPLFHFETEVPQASLEAVLEEYQLYLNPHFFEGDRLKISQQLYDWLVRPAETALQDSQTQTLVFVLDGALRNVPMAALYDGNQYLLEKYTIALNPGLQLVQPNILDFSKLSVLTGGLSEANQGFSALPAVEREIDGIASSVRSTTLLNQGFTTEELSNTLESVPFSAIHLATHGQFSSKVEDTYLVTWNERITVNKFGQLLQPRTRDSNKPLELLVLSACQTAAGDRQAALGLAGIAIRSGARSTLATLWQVNDESTATLMETFYQRLAKQSNISKADALRLAQLDLLHNPNYQHPFYWAPFVLIGNWL